ncbi:odorant receptor 131-2-like [Acanthopagrus schlegelii]
MYANQSQTNSTGGLQYQGLLERVMFSILTTVPCCVFLYINGTMLFTLRSKSVFRDTSRYILLYNLLLADTVLLVHGQVMYILAASKVTLTYPVCGVFTMLANLTTEISPLTLVVMSLERYVAVCYPLRHASIITIRNTGAAIILVWTFTARSASTDKASARKVRNTLLLHLVQLGLSLSSTIHNPMLTAISKVLNRVLLVLTVRCLICSQGFQDDMAESSLPR